MKILAIDIETTPNLAYFFGKLYDQRFGLNQVVDQTRMLCFAASWVGEKKVHFYSVHHDGEEAMVKAAHDLLSEADAALHYNGVSFDTKHLNTEFFRAGLGPPEPFAEIDLMRTVKRKFNLTSNKLDNVAVELLGLKGKLQTGGFDLWLGCMSGDEKAWRKMKRYNVQDVVLLEQAYERFLPWIPNHPNRRLYNDGAGCPRCGAPEDQLQSRGYRTTGVSKLRNLQCQSCKGWSYPTVREDGTKIRSA